MTGYYKEDARNLVMLEIENRERALEVYPLIIPVIEKFDGKVMNKRLETALRKVCDDVRIDYNNHLSYIVINLNCYNNRSCKSVRTDTFGYSCTNYIDNSDIGMNQYVAEKMVDDDNRIKSDVVIKSLNIRKEKLTKEIDDLKNGFDKIDKWQVEIEETIQKLRDLDNEIPSVLKNYYKVLQFRVSSY